MIDLPQFPKAAPPVTGGRAWLTMSRAVLLVDDHGLVRAGIRTLIEHAIPGVVVFEAGDTQRAWDLLREQTIDVVFLDLDLAGRGSGMELLQGIRDGDLPMRVVMLSATTDSATVMACIQAGASGYLPKASEDPAVLRVAIECTMAGGVYLPDSVLSPTSAAQGGATADALSGLSPRTREVLAGVCQGLPNKMIARQLGISEGTVRKTYMTELLRHFGVARRTQLMCEVARRGIRFPLPPPRSATLLGPNR